MYSGGCRVVGMILGGEILGGVSKKKRIIIMKTTCNRSAAE
jgi:hypothetical protein